MKTIFVRFQREGIHNYPNAPSEVYFLRSDHRHIFHIEVELEVFHDDRDLEFILVKRELEMYFNLGMLNHKSCEMICDDIWHHCGTKWGFERWMKIEVSEDGENGARATYPGDKV